MSKVREIDGLLLQPNPNLLINGDMSISQRGAGTYTSVHGGTYHVDRWHTWSTDSSVAHTQFQSEFYNIGPNLGFDQVGFFNLATRDLNTDFLTMEQRIESDTFKAYSIGDTFTLSFKYALENSGTWASDASISINITVPSVENDYTSFTDINIGYYPITLDEQVVQTEDSFTLTREMAERGLGVRFVLSTTSAGPIADQWASIRFLNAKLEHGTIRTPFVADSPTDNLAKCYRYYEILGDCRIGPWGDYAGTTGSLYRHGDQYCTPKRRVIADGDISWTGHDFNSTGPGTGANYRNNRFYLAGSVPAGQESRGGTIFGVSVNCEL